MIHFKINRNQKRDFNVATGKEETNYYLGVLLEHSFVFRFGR